MVSDPDAPHVLPRLVVAAPGSGHGKTTVATGLMAALRARGLDVAPFKVGPDYIDPGYHLLAAGRAGRNLDPVLVGAHRIVPLLRHGALVPRPCDVAIVEGVMGLFDGRLGTNGEGSTAHVARLVRAPILLVVDARHVSRTVAAIVHGLATYHPDVTVSGVVLNQTGSPRHARELATALADTGIPLLGMLPRDAGIEAPSRHLGLVPVAERADAASALDRLAARLAADVDLDAVLDLAATAVPLTDADGPVWCPDHEVRAPAAVPDGPCVAGAGRPVVAVAAGRAFTFRYPETDDLLRAAGCDVVEIDPVEDERLPDGVAGLYLGGGFPQVYAAELADNPTLRDEIATAIQGGLPTVAECAGLLYLCRSLDGTPMTGVVPRVASMTDRLTLGYRTATSPVETLLAGPGEVVTGHEFHRTTVVAPAGGGATTVPTPVEADDPAWLLDGHPDGLGADPAGTGRPTLHASYLHVHWAGHPQCAQRFADAVHRYAARRAHPARQASAVATPRPLSPAPSAVGTVPEALPARHGEPHRDADPLAHHGDRDLRPGLVDLAVNVRPRTTPRYVVDAVLGEPDWTAYPDAAEVTRLVAAHHDVVPGSVLVTAGAAEAFVLVARALRPRAPLVVHPQFTEPERALRLAGHTPDRVVLDAASGFALDPRQVPATADLVVVGNPTNPTSVLHPAATLAALRRRGRVLVVDEAFMDAVPGEPETMLGGDLSGVLVLRSLTKSFGIAGLRAGYVVGDPALVARLAEQQPPWSVGTPALRAIAACLTEPARREVADQARRLAGDRADLVDRLARLGLPVVSPARAPFVLVDTSRYGSGSLRPVLAERGYAVRRGETFPGLGPAWLRVAVRDPQTHTGFADALTSVLAEADGAAPSLTGPPPATATRVGSVILVGAGPGDPDLITVAGLQALRRADVVVYDRLAPAACLAQVRPGAELVDVGKVPRRVRTTQEHINEVLVAAGLAGKHVVRLKGGDPFVFGRGAEEWQACVAAGIPVSVIPGVTSAVAVPASAGIPVTHRTLTQGVTIVSGHVPPDDPRSTVDWDAVARSGTTLVLLMAVTYLEAIAGRLLAAGLAPDTPAALVAHAYHPEARTVRGSLGDLSRLATDAGIGSPAVVVVGDVVALDLTGLLAGSASGPVPS